LSINQSINQLTNHPIRTDRKTLRMPTLNLKTKERNVFTVTLTR